MSYLIKWHITKRKGTDDYAAYMTNWVQASSFSLYDSRNKQLDWPAEITCTSSPVTAKEAEKPIKLVDNDASTKWAVDTNTKLQEVDVTVIFTLPSEVAFAYYSYTTANDVPKRDPISWELYDSIDEGATWNLLDERSDVAIPDDRNVETEIFKTNKVISRESIEDDYNEHSRYIVMKLEVYFDGLNSDPLEVTKDTYLIDAELLEETGADSKNPFGSVSSNELSFSLFNENGIFSPTNKNSQYYGKIKTGVPIVAYFAPEIEGVDIIPDKLGVFYVSDWNAEITGITAEVVANDLIYAIFNLPQVTLPVTANSTMLQLYRDFFEAIGVEASIDEELTETLPFSYCVDANKEFLNELAVGSQTYVFCNRDGVPRVEYARGPQEVKHTLTDNDQIVNISSKQSILVEYTGAEVIMNKPQESKVETLLSINDLVIPAEGYESTLTSFNKKPVYKITAAMLEGSADAFVSNIVATCLDVVYSIENTTGTEIKNKLEILGTYIDIVSSSHTYGLGSLLSVDNKYIQTNEYAEKFLRFLKAYVASDVPVLELEIRGNPKYLPGEKLHIISEKYSVDFTGVLIRQHYKYDGGLSSTIKVINSDIMEVT